MKLASGVPLLVALAFAPGSEALPAGLLAAMRDVSPEHIQRDRSAFGTTGNLRPDRTVENGDLV